MSRHGISGYKWLGWVFAALLIQTLPAFGEHLSGVSQLQRAQDDAELVDLELSDMDLVRRPLDGVSAEGATVLGYKAQTATDETIKKIVLEAFGESYQQRSAYYFRNGNLYYAIEATFTYDKPLDPGEGAPNRVLARIDRIAVEDGKILAWDIKGADTDEKCFDEKAHSLDTLSRSLVLLLNTPESKNAGACGWVCTKGEFNDCGHFECVD